MKNKNKQSQIVDDFNLKPAEIKTFRECHLTEGEDWWKEKTTIYWSDEAIDILSEYLFVKEQNEELAKIENNVEIQVKIVSLANNPKFVYGALDGNKINILCRRPINPAFVGKVLSINKEVDPSGTIVYKLNN